MTPEVSLDSQGGRKGTPTGVLSFFSLPPELFETNHFFSGFDEPVHCIQVELGYDGVRIEPTANGDVETPNGVVIRDLDAEQALLETLRVPQLERLSKVYFWIDSSDPRRRWKTCASEKGWMLFMETMPLLLEECGWRIHIDPSFKMTVQSPDGWYVNLKESGSGMFEAQVGFELSDRRINILPFLLGHLRGGEPVRYVELEDGRRVSIPPDRIELLTASLLELFDRDAVAKNAESVEISWIRAMELARFEALENFTTASPDALKAKAKRLALVNNAPNVRKPRSLKTDLRDYQRQGLNWLQLLRECGFGAVLADDMGLGKTVQALAHILVEKSAGRMDAPCLIVAPTSVLPNWEAETKRFAPSLTVHVSHGSGRADHFENFADYDLIVTSYPLLARDGEELLKHRFHLLILDEAQFIRNHKTIAARVSAAVHGTPADCIDRDTA